MNCEKEKGSISHWAWIIFIQHKSSKMKIQKIVWNKIIKEITNYAETPLAQINAHLSSKRDDPWSCCEEKF